MSQLLLTSFPHLNILGHDGEERKELAACSGCNYLRYSQLVSSSSRQLYMHLRSRYCIERNQQRTLNLFRQTDNDAHIFPVEIPEAFLHSINEIRCFPNEDGWKDGCVCLFASPAPAPLTNWIRRLAHNAAAAEHPSLFYILF